MRSKPRAKESGAKENGHTSKKFEATSLMAHHTTLLLSVLVARIIGVGHVTRTPTTWDSKGAGKSAVQLAGMHKELRKRDMAKTTMPAENDDRFLGNCGFRSGHAELHRGFVRIPIGIVVVVGDETGWDEQKDEKSKSETPRRDMTSKMR